MTTIRTNTQYNSQVIANVPTGSLLNLRVANMTKDQAEQINQLLGEIGVWADIKENRYSQD